MIETIIIAILYAIVRAKHDSYINNGKWKLWAFIEGVLIALSVGYLAGDHWIDWIFLPILFGFAFWIVFDIMCGIFRVGKLWYFGSGKFDQKMKRTFVNGRNYALIKLLWGFMTWGAYDSIIK